MKNTILTSFVICIVALPLSANAASTDNSQTLKDALDRELANVGWQLHWEPRLDYVLSENEISVLKRDDLSVGAKIRLLTAGTDSGRELDVWVCDSFKTLLVKDPQSPLDDPRCANRLNTGLDREY